MPMSETLNRAAHRLQQIATREFVITNSILGFTRFVVPSTGYLQPFSDHYLIRNLVVNGAVIL